MSNPEADVESARQVGQVLTFQVEFACIVERRVGGKRRVNYEVRIDGLPSPATFYVEGENSDPSLGDSEIEGACAHVRKFLRDGITDGIETVLQETYQLTHGGQTPNKAFLKAFLQDTAEYVNAASKKRLKAGVAADKREQWLRFEASAKCHQRTELLKAYLSDYTNLYQQYVTNTNQISHDRFAKDEWDEHEATEYAGKSADFLRYAREVVAGRFTPGEAARQWLSEDMKIPVSSLERRYIRKPFGKRRKQR